MTRIYLDANATTPLLPAVLEAMMPYWSDRFGNASAVHAFGRGARGAVETARDQLASLLGARPQEITFTSGGTESDNLALFGLLQPGDHLVVSAIEHDAVLHAADALEQRNVRVTRVPCDADGVVQPSAVADALTAQTRLVSVILANNETGAVQPIRAIAEVTHACGTLLHTDAVQACGKLSIAVQELGCDLLSLSGHKMHGPQGTGALWVRKGVKLRPLLYGGGHERNLRAGTENVPGIVGLGRAAELAQTWLASGGAQALAGLRARFEQCLRKNVPELEVNSAGADRLPNTCSARFPGVLAEELVMALDMQGVAASGGSACQSGTIEPSHVLRAMGMSPQEARSSVRFSLCRLTTADEVDAAAAVVTQAVTRLRSLHGL